MPTKPTHLPVYGRFEFDSVHTMIARLQLVSDHVMNRIPFKSYLATQDGQKLYGLTYQELEAHFADFQPNIVAVSSSVSNASGKVVRVNVRLNSSPKKPKGQFIISTGSQIQNQVVRDMLLGVWDHDTSRLSSELFGKEEEEKENPVIIPPTQARPKPSLLYPEFTYSKPTITTTDYFYFDTNTAPDTIMMLLNRLSNTFLGGAFFHMRLETTDGDYHLNMDRHELRFMYQYRRDKLLMLYMDAATLDGQWINLRLSFHPLAPGPNGEVDITSHQADEMLQLIYDTVGGQPPPSSIPDRLNESFHFNPAEFSLETLIATFNEISRSYLHRIPPVAFLSTINGDNFTGLSFYQLEKVFPRHQGYIDVLSVGITKIMTGQTLSLMFQFQPENHAPCGTLSMMWGDVRKHDAVRTTTFTSLSLSDEPVNFQPQTPVPAKKTAQKNRTCLISMPGETYWSEALWDYLSRSVKKAGFSPLNAKSIYAHKVWEDTMSAITASDILIADLTYKHPDVLYKLGIAQTLGKKVIIIAQDDKVIPTEFTETPVILYENSRIGFELLAEELELLLEEG